MAQTSGPLTNQTFTDEQWRDAQGDEAGIKHDTTGTSYNIALANNSDVANIGSATQDSVAVVAGFPHRIPAGQLEGITIPPAVGGVRSDLIVLRYDPTWGGTEPGPVRLFRVAGTEGGGIPTYDSAPPGVEDFPLWIVRRTPNTALSQANVNDRRVWIGPALYVSKSDASDLPQSPPLGTQVQLGYGANARQYRRVMDDQGSATWQITSDGRQSGPMTLDPAYKAQVGQEQPGFYSEGGRVYLTGALYQRITLSFQVGSTYNLGSIPAGMAPAAGGLTFPAHFKGTFAAIDVLSNGQIQMRPTLPARQYPAGEIVTHLSGISWQWK